MLAACHVLTRECSCQDSLKSESSLQLPSPRGDVNGSVNNVCTVNPRGLRFEGESERPFLRKSRPKTATARRDGRDPRDAPRSESEHVRRCSDRPQWDGPRVQVDKDAPPDEMALSPSTVRSSACLSQCWGYLWQLMRATTGALWTLFVTNETVAATQQTRDLYLIQEFCQSSSFKLYQNPVYRYV